MGDGFQVNHEIPVQSSGKVGKENGTYEAAKEREQSQPNSIFYSKYDGNKDKSVDFKEAKSFVDSKFNVQEDIRLRLTDDVTQRANENIKKSGGIDIKGLYTQAMSAFSTISGIFSMSSVEHADTIAESAMQAQTDSFNQKATAEYEKLVSEAIISARQEVDKEKQEKKEDDLAKRSFSSSGNMEDTTAEFDATMKKLKEQGADFKKRQVNGKEQMIAIYDDPKTGEKVRVVIDDLGEAHNLIATDTVGKNKYITEEAMNIAKRDLPDGAEVDFKNRKVDGQDQNIMIVKDSNGDKTRSMVSANGQKDELTMLSSEGKNTYVKSSDLQTLTKNGGEIQYDEYGNLTGVKMPDGQVVTEGNYGAAAFMIRAAEMPLTEINKPDLSSLIEPMKPQDVKIKPIKIPESKIDGGGEIEVKDDPAPKTKYQKFIAGTPKGGEKQVTLDKGQTVGALAKEYKMSLGEFAKMNNTTIDALNYVQAGSTFLVKSGQNDENVIVPKDDNKKDSISDKTRAEVELWNSKFPQSQITVSGNNLETTMNLMGQRISVQASSIEELQTKMMEISKKMSNPTPFVMSNP